jgi:hypothetical protein
MVRKRKPKQIETAESYLFAIETMRPDYSFGLGDPRFDRGVYSEHAHTEIMATCLVPQKLSGRETRFILIGDRSITAETNDPDRVVQSATGVGTLTMRGSRSEYLGCFPFDVLLALAPSILAGGLKFIYLSGPALSHGSSRIRCISFWREADPSQF